MSLDLFDDTAEELRRLAALGEVAVRASASTANTVLRRARRTQMRRLLLAGGAGVFVAGALAAGSLLGHSQYFDYVQPSEAMAPTVAVGEIVTVDKSLSPQVGDVVLVQVHAFGESFKALFRYAGDDAHPVALKSFEPAVGYSGLVFPYAGNDTNSVTPHIGRVAVFGDNHDVARDSRYFGFIPARDILGVAIRVRTPGGKERSIPGTPTHTGLGSDSVDPPDAVPTSASVTP